MESIGFVHLFDFLRENRKCVDNVGFALGKWYEMTCHGLHNGDQKVMKKF